MNIWFWDMVACGLFVLDTAADCYETAETDSILADLNRNDSKMLFRLLCDRENAAEGGVFLLLKKMHVLGLQHVLGLSPASIFDFQPIWRAIADFVYARPN